MIVKVCRIKDEVSVNFWVLEDVFCREKISERVYSREKDYKIVNQNVFKYIYFIYKSQVFFTIYILSIGKPVLNLRLDDLRFTHFQLSVKPYRLSNQTYRQQISAFLP